MNIKKFLSDSNKNWWVILVLSLFIIYESVIIIEKLSSNQNQLQVGSNQGKMVAPLPEEEIKAKLMFNDSSISWSQSKSGQLTISLSPLEDISLDGLDLLLEYNPEELAVVSLETTDAFDTVARKLIQPENNRMIISLFELAKKDGISFKSGEEVVLLTLNLKPILKEGSTFVKLIRKTESQPGSQLIEAKTGDKISFEESQYQLTVSK